MVELILFLIGLGVAVTVENPLNSLFWLASFMLKLFDKYPGLLQFCSIACIEGPGTRSQNFGRITRGSKTQIFWKAWDSLRWTAST